MNFQQRKDVQLNPKILFVGKYYKRLVNYKLIETFSVPGMKRL